VNYLLFHVICGNHCKQHVALKVTISKLAFYMIIKHKSYRIFGIEVIIEIGNAK
jgi:hypothetical protein